MYLPPPQVVCVAQAIHAESRGESELGQRAVGHVILNRAEKFKKPPCVIVRQPGQFSVSHRQKYVGDTWNKARKIASYLGKDPTNGALYFKTRLCNTVWHYKLTIVIGGHRFYK